MEYNRSKIEADSILDSDSYSTGFETSAVDDNNLDNSASVLTNLSHSRVSPSVSVTPGAFTRAVLAVQGSRRDSDITENDNDDSVFNASLRSIEPTSSTSKPASLNRLKDRLNLK